MKNKINLKKENHSIQWIIKRHKYANLGKHVEKKTAGFYIQRDKVKVLKILHQINFKNLISASKEEIQSIHKPYFKTVLKTNQGVHRTNSV